MKIQVTPKDKWTDFLLVEAIFDGFHIKDYRGKLEILSEHTEEDKEFIGRLLSKAIPFPVYHLDEWAKNLVKLIEARPNCRVIHYNEFEYVDGAYPDHY